MWFGKSRLGLNERSCCVEHGGECRTRTDVRELSTSTIHPRCAYPLKGEEVAHYGLQISDALMERGGALCKFVVIFKRSVDLLHAALLR